MYFETCFQQIWFQRFQLLISWFQLQDSLIPTADATEKNTWARYFGYFPIESYSCFKFQDSRIPTFHGIPIS